MQSLVGKTIDNYRIIEVVGRGGMGTVYKALDTTLDKFVALKMIEPRLIENKNFLKRFLEEPKLQAKLESPHIVRVFAFRESPETLFIVMEYVDGQTLAQRLRQSGPMPWETALPIFKQMLLAIEHAHSVGVIHRDIKPGNVLIGKDGNVKVTDFGLAKFQKHGDITVTKAVAGTVKYMPPEQVRGLANVDHRGDIYALGITLYEMLAGRVPFLKEGADYAVLKAIVEDEPPPPTTFNSTIPSSLEDIVMRSLRKKADERYQSVKEMYQALERFETISDKVVRPAASPTITILRDLRPESIPLKWVLIPLMLMLLSVTAYFAGPTVSRSLWPPKNYASLRVDSNPQGATLFINDSPAGRTPYQNDSLLADIYSLRLVREGFIAWEEKNRIFEPGGSYNYAPTLLEGNNVELAGVRITSAPAGATVWLNDRPQGKTPFSSDSLQAGDYLIKVGMPGFQDWKHSMKLSAGRVEEVSATLNRQPRERTGNPETGADGNPLLVSPPRNTSKLELRVEPSGSILVNGGQKVRSDNEPATASVAVDKGTHLVRFTHPKYGSREYEISIERGKTKSLTCYFESTVNIQSLDETGKNFFAYLIINGESTGQSTPIANYALGPGTYSITVRRLGYRTLEEEQIVVIKPQTSKPEPRKLVFHLSKE